MAPGDKMLEFTRTFFRGCPDLSTVTHKIVRQKFLTHVGRDHLEPEEKQALKRLVEGELLKMQADADNREGKRNFIQVKRSPAPCSDPERKRSRFNSESDSSSTPSSPDCSRPPKKNSRAQEKSRSRRALEKAVERTDEEQQTDLVAKMGPEESSEEEGEGSVRSSKVWKESPEEDDGVKKEQKGRSKKKAGAKNKQAPSKASASKKRVREESESEEGARQGRAKVGASTGTESHKEGEDSEEETVAKKKEHREPRSRSSKGERVSFKQKNRVGRRTGGLGDREEGKERRAASGGDSSGTEDENSPKSRDKTQAKNGRRQSASSEDSASSSQELASAQGTPKRGTLGIGSSDSGSDTERGVSDSGAGESTKEERKNRSSKKSSKKDKARSSSSDSSPEPTSQKVGSRRGEDHPTVVRLKRYIRACGAYRNYKKLLGSCHSHKECLSVLRAELEALGMKGNPSLEKCRALKEQREEAAEVASLDVANIISSSGRPRRRNAWNPSGEGIPPGELYRRTLDSEEEQPRRAPPDWSHMQGIISSDGESS
ncbi:HIRA-interacting protein 3 [Phodopus roborovskii]|uniref:Hirip3 protein n=1 Tax=Phodopus roborovskii TaxID=109678 RepID=A0AAU9ZKT8_PHORO|nr:HIRA-interacting protein 3 [Phodopus roborovskii]CAH6793121.1 Hirip3 [Phodopus roborovskii]